MEAFVSRVKSSIFNLMATDIESTIGAVVGMCCADTAVDKQTRRVCWNQTKDVCGALAATWSAATLYTIAYHRM